ncbi:hypothetical protein XIS1_440014 [Xenorhabdus innexi]|uniref:Uncharacterized protein n=1 Tax=Xenorhabdus innexi TaxID=290109 RepID=A0A1N6MY42_9GAMM|nr:hypothetical protein XIS1_440014 [Xenorhabdus innexi]
MLFFMSLYFYINHDLIKYFNNIITNSHLSDMFIKNSIRNVYDKKNKNSNFIYFNNNNFSFLC